MKKNVGGNDKQIRLVLGVVFALGVFVTSGTLQIVSGILSFLMFFTGLTNFCLLYTFFGINTCKVKKK